MEKAFEIRRLLLVAWVIGGWLVACDSEKTDDADDQPPAPDSALAEPSDEAEDTEPEADDTSAGSEEVGPEPTDDVVVFPEPAVPDPVTVTVGAQGAELVAGGYRAVVWGRKEPTEVSLVPLPFDQIREPRPPSVPLAVAELHPLNDSSKEFAELTFPLRVDVAEGTVLQLLVYRPAMRTFAVVDESRVTSEGLVHFRTNVFHQFVIIAQPRLRETSCPGAALNIHDSVPGRREDSVVGTVPLDLRVSREDAFRVLSDMRYFPGSDRIVFKDEEVKLAKEQPYDGEDYLVDPRLAIPLMRLSYGIEQETQDVTRQVNDPDQLVRLVMISARQDTGFSLARRLCYGKETFPPTYLVCDSFTGLDSNQRSAMVGAGVEIVERKEIDTDRFRELLKSHLIPEVESGPTGLKYLEVLKGTGDRPKSGQLVTVQVQGLLRDGAVFEDSRRRGGPLQFVIGHGDVVPGLELGVGTMRLGGRTLFVVPPELGYPAGDEDRGIPADEKLIYAVELLGIRGAPAAEPIIE